MIYWKVKVHSIIGRKKSRSSFKIELSGRSNQNFGSGYQTAHETKKKFLAGDYQNAESEKKMHQILNNTSSAKAIRKAGWTTQKSVP